VLVGAPAAEANAALPAAGEVYVIYGQATGFGAELDLESLPATRGFRIDGLAPAGQLGQRVSGAGDVNGDGFSDFLLGSGTEQAYLVFGGDFTASVTHAGTAGADTLSGNSGANRFVAGTGNDVMNGNGGKDVFHGGAGDDIMSVTSAAFQLADGGSGEDTLRMAGGAWTLDLTQLPDSRTAGIESIDLGAGGRTLVLTVRDVLALSDISNELRVEGGSGTVTIGAGWSQEADEVGVNTYRRYVSGAAALLIDSDLAVL
jgi:hypothetical protein